jgi:imidazolonepropionase-like amidohydrolase
VTGATLIDVRDGSRIKDGAIVIKGERITAVGPAQDVPIPSQARIVNARAKYVIPGLWDMHTHIYNQRELDVFFPLLVAHGIVGIRDAEGLLPSEFRELGKQHRYVPRVFACGKYIDGPAPAGVADAAIVDELADKGVDFIKVGSMLPRERFLSIVARAKARGLHVAGHLPIAVSAAEASDVGMRTVEHLWEILLNISSQEDALRSERLRAVGKHLSTA